MESALCPLMIIISGQLKGGWWSSSSSVTMIMLFLGNKYTTSLNGWSVYISSLRSSWTNRFAVQLRYHRGTSMLLLLLLIPMLPFGGMVARSQKTLLVLSSPSNLSCVCLINRPLHTHTRTAASAIKLNLISSRSKSERLEKKWLLFPPPPTLLLLLTIFKTMNYVWNTGVCVLF